MVALSKAKLFERGFDGSCSGATEASTNHFERHSLFPMNQLIALDYHPNEDVEIGELLFAVSVSAANVVNDIRENIRNLVGGRMSHYENLIEDSVAAALNRLQEKAVAKGYDGVISVHIVHPNVVDGGVEVVVYGNGFRKRLSPR